jgi:asparagine synthase (glutamine-hydrolysing)
MTSALARRGPDAEGIEQWPNVTLGHRRLSIFDLSEAGRQPMLLPDRSVGVVFNGAIYNFIPLRRELESAGYVFHSRTDTEVLLHGYAHWDIDGLLQRLRGMFAIGLWDQTQSKLFLVRDRLGVKPLVYSLRSGTLAFASTVRALRDGGFAGELDSDALAEFLEFGFVTDDRTIYEGVAKLRAGELLEWSHGSVTKRLYWDLPSIDRSSRIKFEEAVEQTESIFLDSVKLRLEADVPVGALLSGGVDSSLVCWAIAKLGGNIRTFTIGTPNDPGDESADAVATARQLGVPHQLIELRPDDSPGMDDLVNAYGEPFACYSALGMLSVSQAVKRHATVLLTGDGGDDIFLGYPEHKHFWMAQRLANSLPPGSAASWKLLRQMLPHNGALRRAKHFIDYATGGVGAIARVHNGLPLYRENALLGSRLVDADVSHRQIPLSPGSARDLVFEFLKYDRRTRFTGEYMTKVDGGTMYYALEARSPFLDHQLWEYAGKLPVEIRLRNGSLKAILRELARRHIGERVSSGAKRGFSIPVQRWLAGRWGSDFRSVISDSVLARDGYIHPERVLDLWSRTAPAGTVPLQLWYLYVLEHWMRLEQSHRLKSPELVLQ